MPPSGRPGMSVRQEIALLVDEAAKAAQAAGDIPAVAFPEAVVERPARPEHGDYASSLPLRLARAARLNPIEIADAIAKRIGSSEAVGDVSVAPPGFVNLRLSDSWLAAQVDAILKDGARFADSAIGQGRRV